MEIASLLGGAVTGFLFKYLAQAAADRQAQFEMMLKKLEADDASADKAAQRVPNDKAGFWIRRVIVLTVLFGVIMAPFILALLGKPVIVQIETPVRHWLFGLITTGGKTAFYQLQSYLLVPEVRAALMAIIGFYFGGASAKR